MDKTQEEKVSCMYENYRGKGMQESEKNIFRAGYEACLEANGIGEEPLIPDGYFKIGEEVECLFREETEIPGKVGFVSSDGGKVCFDPAVTIRRIPAWKPKDGEAVLFEDDDNHGRAMAGFIRDGILYARGLMCADWEKREKVKPFDASKIGNPWSEI